MRIFFYLVQCIIDATGVLVGLGFTSLKDGAIGTILFCLICLFLGNTLVKIEEKTDYKRWICWILTILALLLIIAGIFVILVLIEWIFW